MTKNYAELIPEIDDPEFDKEFRLHCRHLVSLAGWYYPLDSNGEAIGQIRFFSFSGFIFSIRGTWCWVTAGHILRDLERFISGKEIKVTKYALIDYFGLNVISYKPIPFDYERAPKYYIAPPDDDIKDDKVGLDFGLVALSPYYQKLLEANNIVPVSEENWIHQHRAEFDQHIMLGLPEVFITTEPKISETDDQITSSVSPVMIYITKLNETPDNLPETRFPRFIGKISDDCPLDNIKGMSGGPIFGFSKEGNRYWIVAVQGSKLESADLSRNKLIFACPVFVFATLVEEMIAYDEQLSP